VASVGLVTLLDELLVWPVRAVHIQELSHQGHEMIIKVNTFK
jgi:hypothetical protein